jgi:hypothetical protein
MVYLGWPLREVTGLCSHTRRRPICALPGSRMCSAQDANGSSAELTIYQQLSSADESYFVFRSRGIYAQSDVRPFPCSPCSLSLPSQPPVRCSFGVRPVRFFRAPLVGRHVFASWGVPLLRSLIVYHQEGIVEKLWLRISSIFPWPGFEMFFPREVYFRVSNIFLLS